MTKDNYEKLGASASKAGIHSALNKAGLASSSSLFASVCSDLAGSADYHSFLHCDGAGTKSIIAYLEYRETGDAKVFRGLAIDAAVMNVDDILCIGKPERIVLGNLIARNSMRVKDDALSELYDSYRTFVTLLRGYGLDIELAGGETADCGDVVRTLLVDAVVSGRINRKELISTDNIIPGDVIVGLGSAGKASYEPTANSGIGSNGLTLARHALLSNVYAKKFPEIVEAELDSSNVYRGPFKLEDRPAGLGMTVGEALLCPTRTYAPLLLKLFPLLGKKLHGLIHNTGGGLTKVLRFGKGNLYVKDGLFTTPAIFRLIQEHAAVPWEEMYRVFNMGHRMEIYIPPSCAEQTIDAAKEFNLDAKIIGRVEKTTDTNGKNIVRVQDSHGHFEFKAA